MNKKFDIKVDDNLFLNDQSIEFNKTINLEEKEENDNSFEKVGKESNKKEYENNDSTKEEFNFLPSFYVDLEKERTKELSSKTN